MALPLDCVIARNERGLSLMLGSGQDATRIHYLPPARGLRDSPRVQLARNPGEGQPRIVMLMDLKGECVKVRHNDEGLEVTRGWFMPRLNLIDRPTKHETKTKALELEVNDAIKWILPEEYYAYHGRYRRGKPPNSEMYSQSGVLGANFFGEFSVAPGEREKRWRFYVQDAASNWFREISVSTSGEPH